MNAVEKWEIELSDERLGKNQKISGSNQFIVKSKAQALKKHWDKVCSSLTKKEKEAINYRKSVLEIEDYETKDRVLHWLTMYSIDEINSLLEQTLFVDDSVDWNDLLDNDHFEDLMPEKTHLNTLAQYTRENPSVDHKLVAKLLEEENKRITLENEYTQFKWTTKKEWFIHKQNEYNQTVLNMREQYFNHVPSAIKEYCDIVLNNSNYPTYFPYRWILNYDPQTRTLLIDYKIPCFDSIKISAQHLLEFNTDKLKLLNSIASQTCIRTIHEIVEADKANAINEVIFNGFMNEQCFVSLQVMKESFLEKNLTGIKVSDILKEFGGKLSENLGDLEPISFKKSEVLPSEEESKEIENYNSVIESHLNKDITIVEEVMTSLSFFDISSDSGKPIVKINKDHPAYFAYKKNKNNNEFLNLILSSWAFMENECSVKRREQLVVARDRWGEMLGDILLDD